MQSPPPASQTEDVRRLHNNSHQGLQHAIATRLESVESEHAEHASDSPTTQDGSREFRHWQALQDDPARVEFARIYANLVEEVAKAKTVSELEHTPSSNANSSRSRSHVVDKVGGKVGDGEGGDTSRMKAAQMQGDADGGDKDVTHVDSAGKAAKIIADEDAVHAAAADFRDRVAQVAFSASYSAAAIRRAEVIEGGDGAQECGWAGEPRACGPLT